ncbi:Calcium-activated chloride channel regulator 4 [Camelus dromedarius]|uniref:Calcium-activated chloride channel regulator 1 n=1 Tax=Camelus dromedarius TaxID=9838 RepID=A0A5N4DBM8_CAMDR|nr:Calcium-activated chloride channel regulator 4 [Camelus dromedarius]
MNRRICLCLLQRSNTSFIQLNDNGYEGIIIAIDPAVPEDETLIEQIKADVLVAPPTLPGRDEPYTKQFTACEEKGEYIHLTPDFVLGKKQDAYGPSGRLFVHEWAHLRWGVFDEYNDDEPFYSASSKKIEATRHGHFNCITGINRVYKCQGDSCITSRCKTDSKTKLYEKDCQFFPDKYQTEKASIMFMQSIDSNYNRLNRMNQAAKHFLLQTVENGSWVGMVHFDSSASIISNLIQISSSSERNKLLESLPTRAGGGTSICSGIRTGFQVIRSLYSQIDGSEIVLLTDGEDSSAKTCIEEVTNSGAIIHFIALGENADEAVIEMSIVTGGSHFYASDVAENNGLIDSFAALTSGNTGASQQSLQLESKGLKLNSNAWMNGTVVIDSTVGKDTFFLITWNQQSPTISLWDPNGTPMENFTVDTDSKMAYLNIPGNAKVNNQLLDVLANLFYSLQAKVDTEILTVTVNSRAANSSVPPITMNAKMNKDTNSFPSPMIVYAEILQGYLPILGANVTAVIESQSGKTEVLELLDNGAGNIEGNPPRPETDEDIQTNLESFTRTATGGAFVVSNVPAGSLPDLYPPSQITDLEATSDEDEIRLTWTAPGDNFDVGKVQQYIIRTSGSILDLRDNFDDALQVNTTDLLPNEANSKETFVFKPGNISEENATHIFIAIQSVDKSNLTSKISNIAQVPLFVPQADEDPLHPDDSRPNSGVSVSTVVLSVVGSVVVVAVVLSTTICILSKKKNSSRPRTGF